MLRIFASALALVLVIYGCHKPAHAAGYPIVTGKCGCRIGWGVFIAKCDRKDGVCTRTECERACTAALPKKSGAHEPMTDVSAARRLPRLRVPDRHVGVYRQRYRGHAIRAAGGPRSTQRMDLARPPQIDRDGRGYATAAAGLRAPGETVTHRRAHRLARTAIRGAAIGGQVAVEYSRPAECRGIAWCGCWLRHVFGIPDRSLNLAINWARVGSPASPESANVVVWRHHVGKLIAHEGSRILVQSGNDRGAVRTRWLSPRVLGGVVAYRKV